MDIKHLGRSGIPDYNDTIWDAATLSVMRKGLRAKFFQNSRLKKVLLSTGNAILAECTDQNHLNGNGRIDLKWRIGQAAIRP